MGIGVILVTLWFYVTTSILTDPNYPEVQTDTLSDIEIIERAKGLGMVSIKNLPSAEVAQAELTDNDIVEKAREFGMLFPEETEAAQGADISYISNEESVEGGDQLTEETDDPNEGEITEEPVETEPKEYIEIRVFAGMTARGVAKLLSEKNIVSNSLEFENYIIGEAATTKIRTGRYRLAKNTDFAEILYLLTNAPD